MKKIIFLLLLTTTIFAQRIWQFPDADTTLSTSLQKNSLIILNQDPTGLGGLNYITRKLKFESLGAVIAKGDTTFVFKNKVNRFTENNKHISYVFINKKDRFYTGLFCYSSLHS